MAQRSVATAAARYGAARSALGLLGPLTWAWLGADLVMRALGTDYCRVVRAVFALAQVRSPAAHALSLCPCAAALRHHVMQFQVL